MEFLRKNLLRSSGARVTIPGMEHTTRSKRKRTAKRLRTAWYRGRVTIAEVSAEVGRGQRTVSDWITGLSLPPAPMLDRLEAVVRRVRRGRRA